MQPTLMPHHVSHRNIILTILPKLLPVLNHLIRVLHQPLVHLHSQKYTSNRLPAAEDNRSRISVECLLVSGPIQIDNTFLTHPDAELGVLVITFFVAQLEEISCCLIALLDIAVDG